MASNLYEKRVKDVMSRDVVTIEAGASIHDALQLMAENKVAALPVVDRSGRCMGMISTSDLVDVTRDLDEGLLELEESDEWSFGHVIARVGDGISHQSVMDLMSEQIASTEPEDLLHAAASRMLRERIHRLPVLADDGQLLGILSTTDILSAFVESAP